MTMDERRIERLARQLGDDRGSGVDPDATAEAVVARLRNHTNRERRWTVEFKVLRAAAVIILVVGSGLVWNEARQQPSGPPPFGVPVALEGLGTGELEHVLDSLDYEAPTSDFVAGGLDDLSESELQELLATMEG
jgi:hypothetical protein